MKVKEISGNSGGFGPQVFTPGDPARVTDPTVARLLGEGAAPESVPYVGGDLLNALSDSGPTSERLKARRAQLLEMSGRLVEAVNEYVALCEQEFVESLRVEHRRVREEGRSQLQVCEQLEASHGRLEAEINRLDAVRSKAALDVAALIEDRKFLPRFAPDSTIRNLETKIAAAKTAHAKAMNEHAAAMQKSNAALPRIAAERQKVTDLVEREGQLQSAILNRPFTHLGIKIADPRQWWREEQRRQRPTRPPRNAA